MSRRECEQSSGDILEQHLSPCFLYSLCAIDSISNLLVASFRMMTCGSGTRDLTTAIICFCPSDSLTPHSPTLTQFHPCGLTKSSIPSRKFDTRTSKAHNTLFSQTKQKPEPCFQHEERGRTAASC